MNYHRADTSTLRRAACMYMWRKRAEFWKEITQRGSRGKLREKCEGGSEKKSDLIGGEESVVLSQGRKKNVLNLLKPAGGSKIKTLSQAYVSNQSITSSEAWLKFWAASSSSRKINRSFRKDARPLFEISSLGQGENSIKILPARVFSPSNRSIVVHLIFPLSIYAACEERYHYIVACIVRVHCTGVYK